MSEPKGLLNKYFRLILPAAIFVVAIYLIVQNIDVFGNILLVVVGFGAVVFIHEFGHFIVAKLGRIKVEAFSIGYPPTLVGIRKTEDGYRVRILPDFFRKEDEESQDGSLSFTVGSGGGRAWETEYRIGLIPFGGYVKMLGQEDTKAAEANDDPRSYANKSVGTRMATIAGGVTFNAVSAVIVFMIVFLIGIRLMPAVVGGVVPGSPAAKAGLRAGDWRVCWPAWDTTLRRGWSSRWGSRCSSRRSGPARGPWPKGPNTSPRRNCTSSRRTRPGDSPW